MKAIRKLWRSGTAFFWAMFVLMVSLGTMAGLGRTVSGCSSQPNLAPIIDPIVQVCVSEMTNWQVVIDLSKTIGVDPGVFARVLCSMPAVIAPYLQKQPDATSQAQFVVLRMRSPLYPDAGF